MQIHRERKISGCQRVGKGEIQSDGLMGMEFPSGVGEENVLELDSDDWLHKTINILSITELYTWFKMANFMCTLPQNIIHYLFEIQI